MKDIKLQIETIVSGQTVSAFLDIDTNIGFGVTYEIDDIRTPEKKNSNHSKNIILLGTKSNNVLMGHLYDINTDFTYFNPNIKVNAQIIIDSSVVIKGYMQLKGVDVNKNTDLQGNKIQYKVIINSESIDLFSAIKDTDLSVLDFSEFDHTLTVSAVTHSWTANTTFESGYVYPSLDNGETDYKTQHFFPAIYEKAYLIEMAKVQGFSIGGSFMDNTFFDKEIIPYAGDIPTLSDTERLTREFRAGLSADTEIRNFETTATVISVPSVITLEDIVTDPFFDNSDGFIVSEVIGNTAGSKWEVNKTGKYNFKGEMLFDLEISSKGVNAFLNTFKAPLNSSPIGNSQFANIGLELEIVLRQDGTNAIIQQKQSLPIDMPRNTSGGFAFNAGNGHTRTFSVPIAFNFANLQLNQNKKLWLKLNLRTIITETDNNFFYSTVKGDFANRLPIEYTITLNEDFNTDIKSNWRNETLKAQTVVDGSFIELNNYIPKNIKQKDVLLDVIKRYNLFVSTDSKDPKKILLDTRDDFYNSGVILNWTDKKDFGTPDKIQFLSELQNKEILFSFKPDASAQSANMKWNDNYTKSTEGDIFGQKLIAYSNEFVSGRKKIESPFSPTIIKFDEFNGLLVPAIDAIEPKTKPRVLFYGGVLPSQDENGIASTYNFNYVDEDGIDQTLVLSGYAYAGHYDNPINPTYDINFGENPFLYYTQLENRTTNNAFNRNWRNYTEQVAEGKLVTSKFNLNEVDISFLKDNMNAKIFVKDAYFNINRIIDFDPTNSELTEVELIKIIDGVAFETEDEQVIFSYTNADIKDIVTTGGAGGTIAGANNNNSIYTKDVVGAGADNTVSVNANNVLFIGESNTFGNDTENVFVLGGSNNTVLGGVKNSGVIGANEKTISTDNTIWIDGMLIKNGQIQSSVNLIEGGFNSTRTLFPDNLPNLIEGGFNELRNPYVSNLENIVDGEENEEEL